MNDNLQNEKPDLLPQVMAVVGFVVMVCLLAWLAVQLVRLIPAVFTNLASVFEDNQRELRERSGEENVVVINEEAEDTPPEEEASEDNVIVGEEPDTASEETASSTPAAPAPTPAAPAKPPVQYQTVATYKVPVSDPNGVADLQVSFIGVGRMTAEGRFASAAALERNQPSAVQFAVKNIGTKTSADWSFRVELPGGITFNSKVQQPLKPSETATLTVAFTPDARGSRPLGVIIVGGNDTNAANNGFRVEVEVR